MDEDIDTDIVQQIRDEIINKSSGIFLWVNLVVHQLNEVQRQDGRTRAVQQRLQEIPEAVKNRPAPNGEMPLYGLFQDIIQKDEKNIDKLVRITQLVYCARQPLNPKQLYVMLHQTYDAPFDSLEISDKILTKHVLEVSKGLAEVTKSEEPTVQFIHETVREFLRDGGLKNISTQSVDGDGHEIMKASCLNQIQAPVSEHLELLEDYRYRGHDRRIYDDYRQTRITMLKQKEFGEQANVKFPFLEYASKNILFHAEESEAMGVSQIEFLECFPIAEWVPMYNLFQKYKTRRYTGEDTPILYILAEHGCDHLIKSSARFRGQYAERTVGEVFQSTLACAIHNGHLDTSWTLVGLDARNRPQNIVAPSRSNPELELIPLLLKLGDFALTRKSLEDWHAIKNPETIRFDFELVNSAEMIDLFVEFSLVPRFPSVGNRHENPRADQEPSEPPPSNTGLSFIRRAIEAKPSLLTSEVWGGRTMLEYAVHRDWQSLVSLYLEYSNGIQPDLDLILHHAAARSNLNTVTHAHRYGANLGSQDENGHTALHLAAKDYVRMSRDNWGWSNDKVLLYLLSKEASCVNMRDYKGRTALAIAAHGSQCRDFSNLFAAFLGAGADINTSVPCLRCKKHDLPLVVFLALRGDVITSGKVASDNRCNLNGRDNFGRTALSCCFAHHHGHKRFDNNVGHEHRNAVGAIGEQLLRQPAVDVNSRDDSGYTILEHFIRRPPPSRSDPDPGFQSFVQKFFQSDRLDPNLQTSNGKSPLRLIVSLYNTWPAEFDDIHPTLLTQDSGQGRFNEHLIKALNFLLETGKVDLKTQRRCAKKAAPELKRIILHSMSGSKS